MDDYKYSQLKMMRTSADFLSMNTEITSAMPKFGIYFSVVTGNLVKLAELNTQLDVSTSSQSTDKKDLKVLLKGATMDISVALVAFANNNENYVLLKEIKLTKTSLTLAEEKFVPRCQKIHDQAVLYINELGEYGITQQQLDDQQELINQFTGKLSSVRLTIGARSNIGDQVSILINQGVKALKSIDLLVNMVHNKYPDFYNQYYSARRIVAMRQSIYAAIGTAIENGTEAPVKGVSVKVYVYTGTEKLAANVRPKSILARTSGAKGRFNIPILEPGMYRMVASKPGFTDVEIITSIANGETTKIDFVMEKIVT